MRLEEVINTMGASTATIIRRGGHNGAVVYAGFIDLFKDYGEERYQAVKDAEVIGIYNASIVRHREWRERGLMPHVEEMRRPDWQLQGELDLWLYVGIDIADEEGKHEQEP